jgi:putative ABC transport system ATP-binding protein
MTPCLQVESLGKTYHGPQGMVRALDGVSLVVNPGEIIVVQGPSGCGKTTLLLAAGGLLQPDAGQVMVGGKAPYEMSAEGRAFFRAAHVGFVFQQFHLIPYLSVLDNILAPTLALGRADSVQRGRELALRFGLVDRLQHRPGKLSTGERQRTALARALLNRPSLLLADEPTGNLDRDNAELVLGYLAQFAKEGGAVLLATHDGSAARYARRVLCLEKGRLAEN